jgi:hypothetical protein
MSTRPFLVIALLASTPAVVASDTQDPHQCKHISDDAQRLACYDAAFGRAEAAVPPQPAPVVIEVTPTVAKAGTNDDDFGSEHLPAIQENEIRARIVGTFNGWSGSTTFKLDNGQVWRQLKNNARPWKPREPMKEPMVTIEKGWLGSYRMRVDGVSITVLVKRIK